MAAGSDEMKLEAPATGAAVGDSPEPHAIDGDKAINLGMVSEYSLYAPQVTAAFLADVTGKDNVANGIYSAFIDHVDNRKQCRQAAGIVSDAGGVVATRSQLNAGIYLFRKNGVQVCGDKKRWAITGSLANADGVSFRINVRITQTTGAHLLKKVGCAARFLKGRRGNLGDAELFLDCFRFSLFDLLQCH